MARVELYCPYCEALITTFVATFMAPLYECEGCGKEVKYAELIRTKVKHKQYAGSPSRGPISAELVGSNSFYDASAATSSLTITGIIASPGDTLTVVTSFANLEIPSTIDWGGQAANDVRSNGSGTFGEIHAIYPTATRNESVVISFPVLNPTAAAAAVLRLRGTAADSFEPENFSFGNGTSTTPSANLGTDRPSSVPALSICGISVAGPSTDDEGTWTDDYVAITRIGTNGGVATNDTTLHVASKQLTSTALVTVGKTGITSRPWALLQIPFIA